MRLNIYQESEREYDAIKAKKALKKLVSLGTLKEKVKDPVSWQRKMREDRELPNRN